MRWLPSRQLLVPRSCSQVHRRRHRKRAAIQPVVALLEARVLLSNTIYYSAGGSIYAAADDGSSQTQVTTGSEPRLSSDGNYLVFHRGGDTSAANRQNVW